MMRLMPACFRVVAEPAGKSRPLTSSRLISRRTWPSRTAQSIRISTASFCWASKTRASVLAVNAFTPPNSFTKAVLMPAGDAATGT